MPNRELPEYRETFVSNDQFNQSNKRVDDQIEDLEKDISDLKKHVNDTFVTKIEFRPVSSMFYAVVYAVIFTVLADILALVVKGTSRSVPYNSGDSGDGTNGVENRR